MIDVEEERFRRESTDQILTSRRQAVRSAQPPHDSIS